ncbi:hypothetical protein PSHT_07665 [Puccinia striiformis]|uniref:Uncharacterized protein n=1 Tax=Puccinia striiformis TaxID=27350 RepID=A0A2S4VVB4_9BASI|nr:hypothetical protein PSHT_07665 [Puccinia striiformis]
MTPFARNPLILYDTIEEKCISYQVICRSKVGAEELIHSKVCSLLSPVKEPVLLNIFVDLKLTGPYNDPGGSQLKKVLITTLLNMIKKHCWNSLPKQYPLRDVLTQQPIARMESLDLHITLSPDQHRNAHQHYAARWIESSAVLLLNDLLSNLSIEVPLLFNAPWRKAMGEYSAAIAERSVDGAQRAEIDKMPMHNDDMSTYNMLQYQTRANRVAACLIDIQLNSGELPSCDWEQFISL